VTFDRATAIRNPQAEFFALGHAFIDAMLQNVGDYGFGGQTAIRVVESTALQHGETKVGYQFNFTIRRRVQREDGDEYLFDFYTVVISAEGSPEKQLAACAAATYSQDGPIPPQVERLLCTLDSIEVTAAYELAKAEIQREAEFWDWDEDVDLIGLAKVAFLSQVHS
jgi:hypothetical protein